MGWRVLIWSLLGYCSGNILFAYLLPEWILHIDIREYTKDRNPGTANVFLRAGIPMGILVLCVELLKGFIPVYYAKRWVDCNSVAFSLIMVAPVLGHIDPMLGKIKGGKGIAVSFGVLLGLLPVSNIVLLLAAIYIFFSVFLCIRPHLYRTILTFSLLAFCGITMVTERGIRLGTLIIAMLVIVQHIRRDELERLQVLLLGRYRLY